jgi:site-specific recombinase XerD
MMPAKNPDRHFHRARRVSDIRRALFPRGPPARIGPYNCRQYSHYVDSLFAHRGNLSTFDGAQKLIERLGEAAELPFEIHAHMLRHAAGYALAARGVDTRTLQAFMGHRSIANTVVYTAVDDKRIRNIWGK